MPYTEQELENLQFYQNFEKRDEVKYEILKNEYISKWSNGVLRDESGTIILFEKLVEGEGSYGDSYNHQSQQLSFESKYFVYDQSDEINNIIDREFSEL